MEPDAEPAPQQWRRDAEPERDVLRKLLQQHTTSQQTLLREQVAQLRDFVKRENERLVDRVSKVQTVQPPF